MWCKALLVSGCSLVLAGCASVTPPLGRPSPSNSTDVVWFTGSSNINHFSCNATQIALSAEAALDDFERTKSDGVPSVKSAAMAIPISSLDCGIRKMNHDLFVTLGGALNPTISFSLSNYVVMKGQSPGSVRMNGLLRLAGRENPMIVYGTVGRDAAGQLRLRGERMIDVRDFGIRPPRRFLGLVQVKPYIDVHFDVAVRPLVDPLGILTSSLQ